MLWIAFVYKLNKPSLQQAASIKEGAKYFQQLKLVLTAC